MAADGGGGGLAGARFFPGWITIESGPAPFVVARRITIPLWAVRRGTGFRLGAQRGLTFDNAPCAGCMLPAIAAASHHTDSLRGALFTDAPAATDGGICSGRDGRRLRGGSSCTSGRTDAARVGPGGRLAHPDSVSNVLQPPTCTRGPDLSHADLVIAASCSGIVAGADQLSDIGSRSLIGPTAQTTMAASLSVECGGARPGSAAANDALNPR